MWQRSIVGFCIVSADLFFLWSIFLLKEELNCYQPSPSFLHSKRPEPFKNKETIQSTKSIQNKVGVTSRKKGETHFCKQSSFPVQRTLWTYTEDVETEWDLFKSAVITSAAAIAVVANVWELKWVVRKELLGGTKKLKKLFVQRKLRLELG